jgi:tryptophanyl-tRNA synthetase
MEKKEIVLSGIRPTGNLHLGNYFGAVKNFVKMQETHTCFFFIADYHSLTTHPTPGNLQNNVRQVLVEYLAAGLDPEKATLYLQSDLPETAELYLFLNMNAYLGELERVTTFKDKARKQPENVNAGLLTYPTLMAADIIIHKADKVPVGKDQEQNLEMARTFARRFNHMYHVDFFPQPSAFNFGEQLVKIPGLDGSGKMGKSEGEGNAIFLNDDPKALRKKVMRAVSDSGPTEMNQVKPEPIENLFSLMKAVSTPDTVDYFNDQYNNCSIRYGDMKKQLAEDMIAFTTPFRERIMELSADQDYITRVMNLGAEKARASGRATVEEVRQIIGFRKYYTFT